MPYTILYAYFDVIILDIWSSECYSEVVAILQEFFTRACTYIYFGVCCITLKESIQVYQIGMRLFRVGAVKLRCASLAYRNISTLH